jgi:glutathione peroxidase
MRDRLRDHGMAPADDAEILWNFEKFLIGRNGKVVARFAPDVTADDQRLVTAIDRELAAS